MLNISDRVKVIVEATCKSKSEFARKIGISSQSISNICNNKAAPSGSTVTAICSVFGVNRAWLETGEGDPFKRDEISERVKKSALPGATVALVRAFESLSEEGQLAVIAFVRSFADELSVEECKNKAATVPESEEDDIEVKLAKIRGELEAEKGGKEKSSVSHGTA